MIEQMYRGESFFPRTAMIGLPLSDEEAGVPRVMPAEAARCGTASTGITPLVIP